MVHGVGFSAAPQDGGLRGGAHISSFQHGICHSAVVKSVVVLWFNIRLPERLITWRSEFKSSSGVMCYLRSLKGFAHDQRVKPYEIYVIFLHRSCVLNVKYFTLGSHGRRGRLLGVNPPSYCVAGPTQHHGGGAVLTRYGSPRSGAVRPQCIIGTQISDILDVTRTRLRDHATRCSASLLSGRMPSTS
jgi:hypothetical protein